MTLTICGAHLWDGTRGSRSSEPVEVRIEEGRIADIRTPSDHSRVNPSTSDSKVFHYTNATILPGLIDAHVHLSIDPTLGVAAQAGVPLAERRGAMVRRAEAMLRAGITTARDLGGGDGEEIALRDRIASGEVLGPRLLCAGQPLTSPGGHCHFWGGEVATLAEVEQVIERQVARGADWIKLMATGGVATAGTQPSETQFADATVAHAVAFAESRGRRVAAHCHGTSGIAQAARSGVRTIEHCSFSNSEGFGADLDADVVADLAKRDLWVSPTVNRGWGRRIEKDGEPTRFFERMSCAQRALRDAGVRWIASTDAGIPGVEHHRLAEGLLAFQRYAELDCAAVLRSATSESARALEIDAETGSIREGLVADLLVVEGDPLSDLRALLRPLAVFARGVPIAAEPLAD
jgi:imidazolonepropionase-like amidohydrolase